MTSIGEAVFRHCTGLTSIKIPRNVTSIGEWAFSFCSSLTSIEIPNSVTSIGEGAFCLCSGLEEIKVEAGNIKYNSRNNCNAIIETASNTLIAGCKNTVIPATVTGIGENAFSGRSLTSIEIPNSVTSIGGAAFSDCTGLTSIKIPSSVTKIEDYAFSGCSGLTSIEIPSSVTSIGERVFEECTGLTSIEIPSSVTKIENYAFSGCTALTSIEIPSSVTSIGERAFGDCDNIKNIYCEATTPPSAGEEAFTNFSATLHVPEGTKKDYEKADIWQDFTNIVEDIDIVVASDLAYNITSEENLTVEVVAKQNEKYTGDIVVPKTTVIDGKAYRVTSVGNNAFYGCTDLTTIELPSSVTSIGNGVFYGCTDLTSIKLPSSVTSIGNSAFAGCTGLTSVKLQNGLTSIGMYSFANCSGLTSVEIPSSVTSIGGYAFYGCSSINSIELLSSLTNIGSGAFQDCDNIKNIYSKATTPPSAGEEAFTDFSATLHVPVGTKKDYQKAAIWENFKNIVADIIPDGIKNIKAERNEGIRYNLRGQRIEQPKKGEIYIENGRKRLAR